MQPPPAQGLSEHSELNNSALRDRVTPRGRFDATVTHNQAICREHFLLRLRIHGHFPQTAPGQFVQLGCRPPDKAPALLEDQDCGEHKWTTDGPIPTLEGLELYQPLALLRRPFSLAGRGEKAGQTWIEILHRVVGVGTRWLADLHSGDPIDLIGPLGNQFELPADKSLALLVGGGVGVPPMFYLAQSLARAGWDAVAFVGATTADLLSVTWVDHPEIDPQGQPTACVEEFRGHGYPTAITTDDGSAGLKGRVTDALRQYLEKQSPHDKHRTVVYTCGPNPMMRAVADLAGQFGVPGQACLEQAMACGMGTCQSCVAKIETHDSPHGSTPDGRPWRYHLTCTAGPVFPMDRVVWG